MPDPWRSVHLTVRHPTHPAKETCLACLEAHQGERNEIIQRLQVPSGITDTSLVPELHAIDQKSESLCLIHPPFRPSSHLI